MGPLITRAGKMRILIIAIICIGILPFTPGGRQQWNFQWKMHLARIHADKLRSMLGNDPRISHLEIETSTGKGGMIVITAEVDNEKTSDELDKIVVESRPPVAVLMHFMTASEYSIFTRDPALK